MAIDNLPPGDMRARPSMASTSSLLPQADAHASVVSWGAILAGAAGAAALSLILLILGTGLGLSSISPWSSQGASAAAVGVSTILWLTFTQLAASSMGGYLAGRLRSRWAAAHPDEIYFRDTAHGFLAWAVATLATAAMLGSAIGAVLGGGLQAGAAVASGIGTAATAAAGGAGAKVAGSADTGSGYFLDSLFRKDSSSAVAAATAPVAAASAGDAGTPVAATAAASGAMADSSNPSSPTPSSRAASPGSASGSSTPSDNSAVNTAEVGRIFLNSIGSGALPPDDSRYVGQLVARSTGLSQQDAEKRVTDTYAKMQAKLRDAESTAREAADKARKGSAYTALWLFISLLIGAFVASWAATFGGRLRDA